MRPLSLCLLILLITSTAFAAERPNILWLSCEDIGPHLGCYGDDWAMTPNIDRLADEGVRYTHAFATSGVCAPARSCLITGVYPTSLGTQFMRCKGNLPDFVRCFPEYLQKSGYYCTNNSKTDYQFSFPKTAWNESSSRAHWRKRSDADQPFFSVFNFTNCHESKVAARGEAYEKIVARLTPEQRRDPADATLPPYYPDTPEARRDWANLHEVITAMDYLVGDKLQELEEDGLAENTIVFFFSDHGNGLPRAKRWLYDSGMHVPLIVRCPEKWRPLVPGHPGTTTDRLVSFVDFGPTVLSLAGVGVPDHMQGVPFLGTAAGEPRGYVYGVRDRMDERYDVIRAVRDKRFKYLRNYTPHLPYDQYLNTPEKGHTLRSMRRLDEAGELNEAQQRFFVDRKPVEELYDTQADPHEIHNLAGSPKYRDVLERLRQVHLNWVAETIDVGLIPEADLRVREQETGLPAYLMVRDASISYPKDDIREAARVAQEGASSLPDMIAALSHEDAAVRYWGATGLIILGSDAKPAEQALLKSLADRGPNVRVAAAHALCNVGRDDVAVPVLIDDLKSDQEWIRLAAAIALDEVGEQARPAIDAMTHARDTDQNKYVARVCNRALNQLLGTEHTVR